MALISCAECGKSVSTEAKTCPSCGAKVKPPKKPASKILKYGLFAVIGVSAVLMFISGQENQQQKKADQDRLAAMTPEARAAEVARREAVAASEAARAVANEQAAARSKALLEDVGMAEVTCSMLAEKRAHDPSSVEWIREERKFNYTAKDNSRAISIQGMRAKNAMGALTKGAVKCTLAKDATGWNVEKFEQL